MTDKLFHKRGTILFTFGITLLISLILVGCQKENVSVFCIGDSTMSHYDVEAMAERYGGDDFPRRGWAMELAGFFDDHVTIVNKAISGISSKNFRSGGHWEKVKNQFQKGDYLIIQFGHNDEKDQDPNRYTRANFEFKENLQNYALEAKSLGVHPIIATSIARRRFDDNGTIVDTHGEYISAARDAAKELGIPLVDLNSMTMDFIQDMGDEESKKMYLHLPPGVFTKLPEGLEDNSHLSQWGAHEVSRMFKDGLKQSSSSLKDYLLER